MSSFEQFSGQLLRSGLTWLGRRRLPQVSGVLALSGLTDRVEIVRERWGVPHVYAANELDAFFAQGFGHALGVQKPLNQVFNRGPLPIGGDTDTPLQTACLPGPSYDNNAWTPSMRLVMDLGELSNSRAVFPIGQSGQLGSPHYDDLIEAWSKGEYHPMLWARDQVEKHAEARLTLAPMP